MNQTKYTNNEKNAIRFSNFKKLETECPFTGLGIKYFASGEEIYFTNDKKYRVNSGEHIIGNEFTKSHVQIDHKENFQGLSWLVFLKRKKSNISAGLSFCDRDRIQTCNPQSRNLMRYSIAPRSLFKYNCIKGNISALKPQAFLICFLTFHFY